MKDCYKTTSPDRYRNLADKAKGMRAKPTEAERLLWEYLRANRLGVKFRRQHPLGDYIADFVRLEKRLVIELDGKCHEEMTEHDSLRDNELLKLGYKTIRFTNEELFGEIENVLEAIKNNLDE
jgi:very-short-patch-repair endonuclease